MSAQKLRHRKGSESWYPSGLSQQMGEKCNINFRFFRKDVPILQRTLQFRIRLQFVSGCIVYIRRPLSDLFFERMGSNWKIFIGPSYLQSFCDYFKRGMSWFEMCRQDGSSKIQCLLNIKISCQTSFCRGQKSVKYDSKSAHPVFLIPPLSKWIWQKNQIHMYGLGANRQGWDRKTIIREKLTILAA